MGTAPSIASLLGEVADLDPIDRQVLLGAALERGAAWLFAHPEYEPTTAERERFRCWVARRRAGTPVAYLLGRRGFWTLELAVDDRVLVPRPETELLVELGLAAIADIEAPRILDLGTGSGAIALALASERPDASVTATDASTDALAVATGNAQRLDLARVRFLHGSWWEPVDGNRFELVLSNPPYLASDDPHLDEGDLPAEPDAALVSGPHGLEAIEIIVAGALAHLSPGGRLLVEHGWEQQSEVHRLFVEAGLVDVHVHRDLAGQPRVVEGRAP